MSDLAIRPLPEGASEKGEMKVEGRKDRFEFQILVVIRQTASLDFVAGLIGQLLAIFQAINSSVRVKEPDCRRADQLCVEGR